MAYLHKDSVGAANIGNTGLYRQYGYNHRMTPCHRPHATSSMFRRQWEPMDYLRVHLQHLPSSGLVVAGQMVALTRSTGPDPGKSFFRFTSYCWTPIEDDDSRAGAEMLNEFLFKSYATRTSRPRHAPRSTSKRACWNNSSSAQRARYRQRTCVLRPVLNASS